MISSTVYAKCKNIVCSLYIVYVVYNVHPVEALII